MTSPLSQAQLSIFLSSQGLDQNSGNYQQALLFKLPSSIDLQKLKQALESLVATHPYILSRISTESGAPCMVESREVWKADIKEIEDIKEARKGFARPMDLQKDRLFRLEIYKTPPAAYLYVDFHHIIADGACIPIILNHLGAAYDGKEVPVEIISGAQIALDEQKQRESEAFEEAKQWFAQEFGTAAETESRILPDIFGAQPSAYKELTVDLPLDTAAMREVLERYRYADSVLFTALFGLTLAAWNADTAASYSTIWNGRKGADSRTAFTMCVHTLPAYVSATPDTPVSEVLDRMKAQAVGLRARHFFSIADCSTYLGLSPGINFGFQGQFVPANPALFLGGETISGEDLRTNPPGLGLSVEFFTPLDSAYKMRFWYRPSAYSEGILRNLALSLATAVLSLKKADTVGQLEFAGPAQLKTLDGFNPGEATAQTEKTVLDLFRQRVKENPDQVAIVCGDIRLSYAQVDKMSDNLAAYIEKSVKPGSVVSIILGRSEYTMIAPLGVLKAGCAYQPLDPSYPEERLNFMIADAAAGLLVADKELLPLLKDYKGPVLTTEELGDARSQPGMTGGTSLPAATGNLPRPENLFILLYTSGSTGVPKGVMLEHRNLVNFCAWYRNYYQLRPGDKVAAYASYGFDACMMDLYPALTTGACVCIIPEETRHDMGRLDAFITETGITHSFMTTQVGVMYAKNYPRNPSLKHLSVGGEKLVSMDPPAYGFHNGYGPTECTIFSTIFDVRKKEANIPIGHALDNTYMYVIDGDFRRLPVGAAGELLIAGAGVGRGYLNRPEKTAETFLENPFSAQMRAYRSGDVVRFRTDGNIEFVGRQDGQVKIRGFRVELKEVEEVLRACPGVKDVTVQAFDSPSGGKFIAAYVVAEGTFDSQAASAFIRERKPPYMVPAAFVQLDKIPLNVNQKVDRKALPKPVPDTRGDYVAPEGELEKNLCAIFAEVLGLEKVGATDNFFDLGGSSLMVTNVLVQAEKRGLQFAYADVFAHPTARELAAFLSGGTPAPKEDGDVSSYDYSAIDTLLSGNTLEALGKGRMQPLGGQILLTGATGFLGIHMLRDLLENTSDDTVVWCLLRPKGTLNTERRLSEMLVYYFEKDYRPLIGKRIRLINGDITQPAVFDSLKASGTPWSLVVNCAANVKHFSKGTDIEDINYGGVKNLCAFCEATAARLVHVSTESVAGMSLGSHPVQLSEQQLYFGQQTNNQYVHSKFLAERYILERMAAGALNAKILRAGNLSPRASDGEFQVNLNANAAMGRIKAYKLLGACPYSLLDAKMEFSPIDESARAMVLLAQTPKENCVFNVSNNHLIPMEDILSRLSLIDGKKLEYVEFPEFLSRMQELMSLPQKAQQLSSLVAYAQSPAQAETVVNQPSVHFTMQVLYRLGFSWDHTSSKYVDMIFEMLRTLRYFD